MAAHMLHAEWQVFSPFRTFLTPAAVVNESAVPNVSPSSLPAAVKPSALRRSNAMRRVPSVAPPTLPITNAMNPVTEAPGFSMNLTTVSKRPTAAETWTLTDSGPGVLNDSTRQSGYIYIPSEVQSLSAPRRTAPRTTLGHVPKECWHRTSPSPRPAAHGRPTLPTIVEGVEFHSPTLLCMPFGHPMIRTKGKRGTRRPTTRPSPNENQA
ncbi:hypothetical protein BD414DRAFT_533250 [Trametes punicea]|nr:hypothetical protein BD414DRAFT_533250 [Trametes punicea]